MAKAAFDGKRGTTFRLDPFEVRLVGGTGPIDVPAAGHPLADPEAGKPAKPETIANIRLSGQIQPIKVYKDHDGTPTVVAGRGRLKAIRAINEQDGLEGDAKMLIVCELVPPGTTVQELEEMSMAENAHRKQVDPLVSAQKAAAYIKRHGGDDETLARCANANNLTVPRLKQLLTLLERGSAGVVKAIKSGELGVQAALALIALPPEEQDRKMSEAKESGARVSTHKAQAAAREAKGHRTAPTKKAIKSEIEKLLADRELLLAMDPVEVLQWIVGDADCPDWKFKKASR